MMISDDVRREALREFTVAYRCQRAGELGQAIFHYKRSIELIPTAEAHTFLGWAYSFQGRLDKAIQECRKAIDLDPSLGNPYNDIGAYLIELGRPEDALVWLTRALKATRYENHSYPWYNLGRAHELLGHREEAHTRYQNSIDEDPAFTPALLALKRLRDLSSITPED
ncbi:tetratricopeptide repeat protein [Gemmatimonadota bacterium]